jgi:hypothetical protein
MVRLGHGTTAQPWEPARGRRRNQRQRCLNTGFVRSSRPRSVRCVRQRRTVGHRGPERHLHTTPMGPVRPSRVRTVRCPCDKPSHQRDERGQVSNADDVGRAARRQPRRRGHDHGRRPSPTTTPTFTANSPPCSGAAAPPSAPNPGLFATIDDLDHALTTITATHAGGRDRPLLISPATTPFRHPRGKGAETSPMHVDKVEIDVDPAAISPVDRRLAARLSRTGAARYGPKPDHRRCCPDRDCSCRHACCTSPSAAPPMADPARL